MQASLSWIPWQKQRRATRNSQYWVCKINNWYPWRGLNQFNQFGFRWFVVESKFSGSRHNFEFFYLVIVGKDNLVVIAMG